MCFANVTKLLSFHVLAIWESMIFILPMKGICNNYLCNSARGSHRARSNGSIYRSNSSQPGTFRYQMSFCMETRTPNLWSGHFRESSFLNLLSECGKLILHLG
jgi:hypothetical protein